MAKKNTTKRPKSGDGNGRNQMFSVVAPTAKSVQLVGDFTQWQQSFERPRMRFTGAVGSYEGRTGFPPCGDEGRGKLGWAVAAGDDPSG